jgi:hypothetical protein
MSRKKPQPMEVYVRHQSGPTSMLTFHLSDEQRLQLIAALASGRHVEMPAKLELFVQSQWQTNPGEEFPHLDIPLHMISFSVMAPE